MITAKIIADSISPENLRLTTMELCYPKFPHADLMTHRNFSRSARSSRAVPVRKMLHEVRTDPVEPVLYMKNQAGMQASELMDDATRDRARSVWRKLASDTANACEALQEIGLHKQWANRPLDCFSNIYVVVTSVYWKNWYGLRRHKDAQPEIRVLADAMYEAHKASRPIPLQPGQWHLPYLTQHEIFTLDVDTALRVSTARCARVSYKTFEGKISTVSEDMALFDKLMGAQPLHASPAEHQATPDELVGDGVDDEWQRPWLWGNFKGWCQFRKTLPHESGYDFECDIPGVL